MVFRLLSVQLFKIHPLDCKTRQNSLLYLTHLYSAPNPVIDIDQLPRLVGSCLFDCEEPFARAVKDVCSDEYPTLKILDFPLFCKVQGKKTCYINSCLLKHAFSLLAAQMQKIQVSKTFWSFIHIKNRFKVSKFC